MIKATKPKTETKPTAPPSCLRKLSARGRTMYTVVSCPGDDFSVGASFNQHSVAWGLQDGTWPEGMIFTRHKKLLIVRGGHLVNEAGGLFKINVTGIRTR